MDNHSTVALFGEASKGAFQTGYYCRSLSQLEEFFGNPPPQSKGLYYAVQALLYHYDLIFFRVREEGFSIPDYINAIGLLQNQEEQLSLSAIGIPGVGCDEIIQAVIPLCLVHHSILITSEADLYDYLTHS